MRNVFRTVNSIQWISCSTAQSSDRPIHAKRFIDSLYVALAAISIDEEKGKAWNLDLPSWQHFRNSISRGKVPDEKLRPFPATVAMTDRYTHILEEDFVEIRKVQEEVFGKLRA